MAGRSVQQQNIDWRIETRLKPSPQPLFKAQNAGFEHQSTSPFSAGSAARPRELYVAPVAVNDEERDDVRWCLLDTRLQRSVNPCNHHPLDHPCWCLIMILMIGANVTNSFVAILPSSWPVNTTTDCSTIPSAQIVTATIACFVSFVDVQMCTVLTPLCDGCMRNCTGQALLHSKNSLQILVYI